MHFCGFANHRGAMNGYFLAAGIIALIGGLAHTILGHKWTVNAIDPSALNSTQNSGRQDKLFLTWFWHVGSVVLLSSGAALILTGSNSIHPSTDLMEYISFLWISITLLFLIVVGRYPIELIRMLPGLVGVPVNVLILLGLYT